MSNKSLCLLAAVVASFSMLGCSSDDGKSNEGLTGSQQIDACAIVTEEDGSQLFGKPAVSEPPDATGGIVLAQCHWSAGPVDDAQLLQFYVWEGTEPYSTPSDSEPLAVGEKGNIRVVQGVSLSLVDIQWIQNSETTVSLGYQGLGASTPVTQTQIDMLKSLAQSASSELAAK